MAQWSVGLRPIGEVDWMMMPDTWKTLEEADRVAVMMAYDAMLKGLRVESAVFFDGHLDHEHNAPRRVAGGVTLLVGMDEE
jgi:hypothetical protein